MSPRMSAHRGLKPPEKTRSVPVDGKSMASSPPESHSPGASGWFDSRSATDGRWRFTRTSELSVSTRPPAGYANPLAPAPAGGGDLLIKGGTPPFRLAAAPGRPDPRVVSD